jgi:hypothetical protein
MRAAAVLLVHPRSVIEPLARQSPATIDVLRWR